LPPDLNFQNPQTKSNSTKNSKIKTSQQNFFAEKRPTFSFNKEKTSPQNSTASTATNNSSSKGSIAGFLNLISGRNQIRKKERKLKIVERPGFVVQREHSVPQVLEREELHHSHNNNKSRQKLKVERTGTISKNHNFNNRGSINSLYGSGPGFERPIVTRDRDSLREHHERLVHIQSTFRKADRYTSIKSSRTVKTEDSTVGGEA